VTIVYRRAMSRGRVIRLALLGALVGALIIIRYTTSFGSSLSTARVRELVQQAGPAGVALFVLAFAVGELLHVPGLVFVAAAVLAWGRIAGGALAYGGALVAVSFSFAVVRAIGGQPLGEVKQKWVRAMLAQLDKRPIRTVALLRLVLWIAPALNYALALSPIRYRDYVIGSAIGLALPVATAAAFLEFLLR
jgi:uncharacterized membrane protein YdjX (TVP38/TMEM64 family)